MCIKHITFTDQNSAFIDLPKYTRLTVGRCHHPQGCSMSIDHPGPFRLLSSLEHRLGTRAERRADRSNDLLAVLVARLGLFPWVALGRVQPSGVGLGRGLGNIRNPVSIPVWE